jgi:hypothetical protein
VMTGDERVKFCKRCYENALSQPAPEEIRTFRHNYWRSMRDIGDPVCSVTDCLNSGLRMCANRHWVCADHWTRCGDCDAPQQIAFCNGVGNALR